MTGQSASSMIILKKMRPEETERRRHTDRLNVIAKPQCVHRRKPVPSRGHSETECRRESLNVAHYLFLPGRSGRRRIGYDFIKLGNIAFLMSHVNIHLWCRGSPERGIPTLPSWPGAVLRRSPSSVLPLRHPADYGNSTHSVCPGMCSRSCVPMRMCPQKHMR